jgi:hypothetical protein
MAIRQEMRRPLRRAISRVKDNDSTGGLFMPEHRRFRCWTPMLALVLAVLLSGAAGTAAEPDKGIAVFSAGHSFHVFMPRILTELAQAAGHKDHVQKGVQSIGGSRVIQHWNRADDSNTAKAALRTGKIDVMTLSPIYLPDEGIENFVKLALEHNPNVRVTVQEFWLPYDVYDVDYQKKRPEKVDRNARTGEELRKIYADYAKSMDDHVRALNEKYGKPVLQVVPVGQAVIALREKIIAGQAPGLKMQDDLFTDAIGHAKPPLQALAAYCHYAVLYRRSPVGLPIPAVLGKPTTPDHEKLNRLLQELAWEAAVQHPLSGVK